MKHSLRFAPLFACLLLATCSHQHETFFPIPRFLVYNIQSHGDSIYFSTLSNGIFRFSPDHPESAERVGGKGTLPIRSIVFANDGTLFAASYQNAVYYLAGDTLLPFRKALQRAWSIKIDDEGTMWLAGLFGIFRIRHDTLERFGTQCAAHDIAIIGNAVAAAHSNGISIFAKNNGALLKEYCKGVNCWTISSYDSLLVGGGLNLCAVISGTNCRSISLGAKRNFVWGTARHPSGIFYLATQQGVYRLDSARTTARCVGFKGNTAHLMSAIL